MEIIDIYTIGYTVSYRSCF